MKALLACLDRIPLQIHRLPTTTRGRILLLVIVILLPMLLSGIGISYSWYRVTLASEYQANLEIARSVSNSFEAFIQNILSDQRTIGVAIAAERTPTTKELNHLLTVIRGGHPAIIRINWLDPRGTIIASNDPKAIGLNLADRDWNQQILHGREWVVSDLLISKVDNRPIFVVARSVRSRQGLLLGIVDTVVDPAGLDKVLALPRNQGGGIAILDAQGKTVYRYPSQPMSWGQRDWLQGHPLVNQALSEKEDTGIIRSDDGKHNYMTGTVPVMPIGWVSSAFRDEHTTMAPVVRAVLIDLVLFLLTALLALLVATRVSHTITQPLRHLYQYMIAAEQGEYLPPQRIAGPREVDELATAFTRMAVSLKVREEELRTVSLTDHLTGLYNRRGFMMLGEQEVRVAGNLHQRISLLYVDVNNLKIINDVYGHLIGDQALMAVATTLRASCRTTDLIARLGGDEFAILGWNLTPDAAEHLRERIKQHMSEFDIGIPETLSVSVGVAISSPEHSWSLGDLLAKADAAMYDEKKQRTHMLVS